MASQPSSSRDKSRGISPSERFTQAARPTPPASPTKRRRVLRGSLETDGETSIGQYLYRTDDYRKSSFANPLPLPWKIERPEANFTSRFPPLVASTKRILQERNLNTSPSHYSLEIVYLSRPDFEQWKTPRLTLIIQLDAESGAGLEEWGPIKDAVVALIRTHKLSLEVELIEY